MAAVGEPVRLERGEWGRGRDRRGRRGLGSALSPGGVGQPSSETRNQVVPRAGAGGRRRCCARPRGGRLLFLTDPQTRPVFTRTVREHSTVHHHHSPVHHHLSAFADTTLHTLSLGGHGRRSVQRCVKLSKQHTPSSDRLHTLPGVGACTTQRPRLHPHSPDTQRVPTERSRVPLFVPKTHHYFHHNLTCIRIGGISWLWCPSRVRRRCFKNNPTEVVLGRRLHN